MYKNYNPSDKESILQYAKGLIGKTFNDICNEDEYFLTQIVKDISPEDYKTSYENKNRKGGLGEIIEERYFHYKADNFSRADFSDADLELKVSPYKINKNGTVSAKERLIISMINYIKIIEMDFYNSNAWDKLKNILLVYYLWEPSINNRLDYLIKHVYKFSPNADDLKIIENDFYKIRQKVIDGKAHELSESDTLYLGAATKSSDSKQRTLQPNSTIPAKPRAFSLKASYMTYVLRNYIIKDEDKNDRILKTDTVPDFEEYVLDRIKCFNNIKDVELFEKYLGSKTISSKNKYSRLVLEILGVKTKNAEEFEKANVQVKVIRVEENNRIKESMSFPAFEILDLINQKWENSYINKYFGKTRFLFVIFQKSNGNYFLKGAKFWNMPIKDLEGDLKEEWERSVKTFKEGVKFEIKDSSSPIKNNLPKMSDTNILHVRPHARKAAYLINGIKYGKGKIDTDTDLLPDGNRMTKQCFWLNNNYVLNQIKDIIN
ncbi:Sau3AI family type II restriction endonuclease [Facklamia sp. P13069]|uniref:Sau3AI family type II restriction endonuclease n=1 Tax=Facklamia sp. P13069 TaxID=3421954 RepID=UPI003D16A790